METCMDDLTVENYSCKMLCKDKSPFEFDFQSNFIKVFLNCLDVIMLHINNENSE